jgi:WD40 repeat protein
MWGADSGAGLFEIKQMGLTIARFSPNGELIMTAAEQGNAALWDAATGQRLRQLATFSAQMRGASLLLSASFSPDGNRVAVVDYRPAVIEVSTGKVLFELEGHARQVRDIGYSPDGQWLVTAADEYTAEVFETWSGPGWQS